MAAELCAAPRGARRCVFSGAVFDPKTQNRSTRATAVVDISLERAKGVGNWKHIRFVGMYEKFGMRRRDAKHVSDT